MFSIRDDERGEVAVRFRAFSIALAAGVLSLAAAAPAFAGQASPADHTSGPKCANDVCVTVWNSAAGSNYIDQIEVSAEVNPKLYGTYVWTLSSYGVQATATGYGAAYFHPDRTYAAGRCISGFIDGNTGSAPCWIVP
jgi:hypothetical protein